MESPVIAHVEGAGKLDVEGDSPTSNTVASSSPANGVSSDATTFDGQAPATDALPADPFPPSKTDKPRPHQCLTCGRSFARLEHLKRHERSHTKEKPFECPECTRCFARRDLLLRHQQKLHLTGGTTRPRMGRRESTAGTGLGAGDRVRKNSAVNMGLGVNLGPNGVRPRANTLGHLDLMHFDPHYNRMEALGLNIGNGMGAHGFPPPMDFDFSQVHNHVAHHGGFNGLPKLDTHVHGGDMSNSLRTAPPAAHFGSVDFMSHSTINPAALHGSDGAHVPETIPFGFEAIHHVPSGDDFGWIRGEWSMQNSGDHEGDPEVFDESSPSRISSGDSPGDFSESLNNSHANLPPQQQDFQWPLAEGPMQPQSNALGGGFQLEALGNGFAHLGVIGDAISPSQPHPLNGGETYFQSPVMQINGQAHMPQTHLNPQYLAHMQQMQMPELAHGHPTTVFGHPLTQYGSHSPSMSSASMNGGSNSSARQSASTALSTDSITESTRQSLINTLSQPSVYGGHLSRKYSQPGIRSPLSAGGKSASPPVGGPNLPNVADIRRYVEAFIQYAHTHLPIVHYPSLSFDSIESSAAPGTDANANGAKCLLLSMAALGALYEYDHPASKELFNASKKMIALYLEEKRKNEMANRQSRTASSAPEPDATPPLWLVQAILLNVIHGHHCGEKLAAEVASQHISSLIGLMRAAKVSQALANDSDSIPHELLMNGAVSDDNPLSRHNTQEAFLHAQWIKWKTKEERKRCFFAMFFVSSLLMIAYNQTPAIMNSEITLPLPCEEELYNAESAQEWQARGGLAAVQQGEVRFDVALSTLLSANQHHPQPPNGMQDPNPLQTLQSSNTSFGSDLKPSTFGCLILITALHNFIWETRSRHADSEWTQQRMDTMINHVEPALKAWHAAWKANDHHRIERPNPFGMGPLAADCIPLLDLAFLRLYVNLGPTTEAFWQRDFERMAIELSKAKESIAAGRDDAGDANGNAALPGMMNGLQRQPSQGQQSPAVLNRREKQLRKASFYAIDSLNIACQYNLTFADQTAHELPIQSAICFLDCVQLLSEWITAVQQRVGPSLGVLGRDPIDFAAATTHGLLEAEDVDLFHKIDDICVRLEQKRLAQENLLAVEISNFNPSSTGMHPMRSGIDLTSFGFAGKITRVTAMMLEKAVIWPITHVMAKALEVEAQYMDRRAEASCHGMA